MKKDVYGYRKQPVNLKLASGHIDARFEQALAEWSRRTYKGDIEAARLYNLGVAQEALAYKLPVDSADHRRHLEQAAEAYRNAHDLDPGEKYFAEPIQRVETSMVYARAAADLMAERARWAAGDGRQEPAVRGPERRPAALVDDGAPGAAPAAWTFDRGSIALDSGRGKVLQLDGTERPAVATQRMDVAVGASAAVSLDYKVVSDNLAVRER